MRGYKKRFKERFFFVKSTTMSTMSTGGNTSAATALVQKEVNNDVGGHLNPLYLAEIGAGCKQVLPTSEAEADRYSSQLGYTPGTCSANGFKNFIGCPANAPSLWK